MNNQRAGLLVIGASLAGLRAVEAARREGYAGTISLVGDEPHLPYDRPPLSKEYLSDNRDPDFFHSEAEISRDLHVNLRLSTKIASVDTTRQIVRTSSGEELGYERLIIATGASPRSIPNLSSIEGVFTLRTADDALRLRASIKADARIVVIGAGFIGSEIASSARSKGAIVTIIEAAPIPLVRAVGNEIGRVLGGLHARYGTRLLVDTSIEEVLATDRITGLRLSNGETVDADVVVVGIGASPATAWLGDSGIELNPIDGGVVCDKYLHTSAPNVYAAGDVTHWPNGVMDLTMRLENWTNAADQGERAAINALFPDRARPFETVPYFWSDWYGNRIQFVGSAAADEVVFVSGGPDDEKFVALYRSGDRVVGAATLNERRVIMKLRRHIADRGSWAGAIELVPGAQPEVVR
jgi:NADPH-dependent 2,4-dienoyl-CoA reductase/sulfur reductase-like enzyme